MATSVFTVVATLYPKAGREAEVEAILIEQAAAVRKAEPDCLVSRPPRLAKPPTVFRFWEPYRTRAAFDLHRPAPRLAACRERHRGLLARPTEVEFYRSLTE